MEKAKIIEILEDWNFWKKTHGAGIERREYLNKLKKLSETGQILAIIGVRRGGKSTIMLQFIKHLLNQGIDSKNILYVNFEDVRFQDLNLDLLNKIYDTYLEYVQPNSNPHIFLDEIQKVYGWERFVRTLHELKKASVYVSGSNAKMLSGELATVLTGRHLDLRVFPLNFKEFLFFNGLELKDKLDLISKRYKIKALLSNYLEYGGFPLVCLKKTKKELLQSYFEDIINKDVIEKHTIDKVNKIKSLAKFYLTNIGRRISFNKIAKSLNLSLDSVERYSYYLEEAYLINFIKKFSYSVKEQERTMAVVYSVDNGLRNVLGFKFSEDFGWLYQNIVANVLIEKHGKESLFYWMNPAKEEVDFVVKERTKIEQLIQVCYSIEDEDTEKREIRALLKASEELRCKELLVITEDYEGEKTIENKKIHYKPLWKWLLE